MYLTVKEQELALEHRIHLSKIYLPKASSLPIISIVYSFLRSQGIMDSDSLRVGSGFAVQLIITRSIFQKYILY